MISLLKSYKPLEDEAFGRQGGAGCVPSAQQAVLFLQGEIPL